MLTSAIQHVADVTAAMWSRRDPRVRHRPLQSHPLTFLTPLVAYMLMIIYGPRIMRHRKPQQLKLTMAAYNLLQVSLSAYMLFELTYNRPQCWSCAPMEVTRGRRTTRMMSAVLLFHYSKLIDFLDTVFLLLKKDFRRMSYLHTFHHASMFFNFWLATLYTPGDPAWMECAMNSFVHCIMYSYYFLAALGPRVRRLLWWKRYLTQLQLLQFAGMLSHLILMQTPGFRCHVPVWALAISFVYVIVIICFFVNFYIKCYRRSQLASVSIVKTIQQTEQVSNEETKPKSDGMWSSLVRNQQRQYKTQAKCQ